MIWARLHPVRRQVALWLCPELRIPSAKVDEQLINGPVNKHDLLLLAEMLSEKKGWSLRTTGLYAGNETRLFYRLKGTGICTLQKTVALAQWFSDHWPVDLVWPTDIPRPPRSQGQDEAEPTAALETVKAPAQKLTHVPAVTKLGGCDCIAAHLRSLGFKRINVRGVKGWQARGRVPGYAILALTKWGTERGIALTPEDSERLAPTTSEDAA